MTIRWTKALSVGIESIDEQHKELFRRAGTFLDGLAGRSRQDVGILLSYLRTYAVGHFGDEEEAMREAHYPGYECHRAHHDRFLVDLLALSEEHDRHGGPGVAQADLGSWVKNWLIEHVSEMDVEMARFFLSRRRMGSAPTL